MGLFGAGDKLTQQLADIIDALVATNELLVKCILKYCCPETKIKSLSAIYYTVSEKGDIIVNQKNKNQMGQTITVQPNQNSVPGQIIGLAADGITQEPLDGLDQTSLVFTTSDATVASVAPVAGGAFGQFAVTRNGNASGSVVVNYSAKRSSDGVVVNGPAGGDTFNFLGQPQGVVASLSAVYGTPS